MRNKKEEIVIPEPEIPASLSCMMLLVTLLAAIAVAGIIFFTTEGIIRAALLAVGAGVVTLYGTAIAGATLIAITSIFYRGWDKRFSSQAEYEAWKTQKEEAERQREEERERKRKETLAKQEELRKARERKLRQVREETAQLIAEMEADPMIASMLRIARQDAPEDAGRELLANVDIAIAGLGAWLTKQGVPNRLPGDLFAAFAKGKIENYFSSMSPGERTTLRKYLPKVARVLEEALEVMSPRKVVKKILLPLFFGEMINQAQDE